MNYIPYIDKDSGDLTRIFMYPEVFKSVIKDFQKLLDFIEFDKILSLESRGFILGGALSLYMKKPLILARKGGKHKGKVIRENLQTILKVLKS